MILMTKMLLTVKNNIDDKDDIDNDVIVIIIINPNIKDIDNNNNIGEDNDILNNDDIHYDNDDNYVDFHIDIDNDSI